MVHINVYMDISAKVNVVIPFTTKPTVVRTQIPITQGLFMGEVPNYYFKGSGDPDQGNPVPTLLPPIQLDGTNLDMTE